MNVTDLLGEEERATVYLHAPSALVTGNDGSLVVQYADTHTAQLSLERVMQIVVVGNTTLSSSALSHVLAKGIEVCFLSLDGEFRGRLTPPIARNVVLRQTQYRMYEESAHRCALARTFVCGKLENMRLLLQQKGQRLRSYEVGEAINELRFWQQSLRRAGSLLELNEIERNGASSYFRVFGHLLQGPFSFPGSSKIATEDPVSALLSLGYTLLLQHVSAAIQIVGLDPYVGFLHQPLLGKPALVLDLMEEFRPLLVDTLVLELINQSRLGIDDFAEVQGAFHLRLRAQQIFSTAFEVMLEREVLHPYFGYRVNYRRCLELQVRLLGKYFLGEIPQYLPLSIKR